MNTPVHIQTGSTPVEELKKLELRFLMAEDNTVSNALQVIFVDILRKFFELDVLEVRSLEATEKIQTLVGICNCIRDRILTSGNKIKIPLKSMLEFMIIEEFSQNIHLNKIIQLYLQEILYEMMRNALLQNTLNKLECAGLLFQAFTMDNLTESFRHRLFLLFVQCIPQLAKDFKENLKNVGFPEILTESDRISKLNSVSAYLLDYYNFLDQNSGVKSKIAQFKTEMIEKDTDASIIKFGLSNMNLNDVLRFLQINLLDFLFAVYSMQNENDSEMASEEIKDSASQESYFPSYSHNVIPVLIMSTASIINEVNEKAKTILKSFEKNSDINKVEVWSETMKFYLNIVKKAAKPNIDHFDDQTKKTVLLYARNLKKNVLEYALKCEVTAKLPQLLTAINDQGVIRLLGLRFVDHMINHLPTLDNEKIKEANSRTIYTLLTKIIQKQGFLSVKERSFAYQSLVEVIIRCPELLEFGKKNSLDLVDETFNEFDQCSSASAITVTKDDEIYSNWIKCLGRLKILFSNSSQKGFVITKMKERIESIINNHGIDNDKYSMTIYICLSWIEHLCNDMRFPFSLMYICIILSHANDLKIKDKATKILDPLLKKLQENTNFKEKGTTETEEVKAINENTGGSDYSDESFVTSMYIKKVSQFSISSMKAYSICENLLSTSIVVYKLIENEDERLSLQDCLESKILELFIKSNLPYSLKLSNTLEILRNYIDFIYSSNHALCREVSEYNFLFSIIQSSSVISERKIAFDILERLMTVGNFTSIQEKCFSVLESFNYQEKNEYGVEIHGAISNLCILLIIAYNHHKKNNTKCAEFDYQYVMNVYYGLCSDFNKISNYKAANLDKINNFANSISKLGAKFNIQQLTDDQKCSNAFDDLLSKFIEIIDNKELSMDFRKFCVEEYILMLFKHNDGYLDHIRYLRDMYIEYDQYEFHQSIGINASRLIKEADLNNHFDELTNCILSKDSTLIAKRASIVQLSEFLMNSDVANVCQEKLIQFQSIFFKYIFDKKDVIQECASNVLTKLYQLGDANTREQLVANLTKTLSGSQTLTHMQEKEEDFELNIEYKSSTDEGKKLKTFKDLCDIATDIGHNELIYQFLNIHRHLNHYKNIKKAAQSLHGILLEDQQIKADMMNIIPKIFLMTYDYNEDIRNTMKEVMNVLIIDKEEVQIIREKWDDIVKELSEAVNNQKEFRKRLAGLHAFSDIIVKEEWLRVKPIFEKLFNISFKLVDDVNDNVKQAAFGLLKTLKKITLRNGNVYTNTDLAEIKTIFDVVMPLILKRGIVSHLSVIKFYSVFLLSDILETTKEESVVDKLKVKGSREDRQLNYTYNSKAKMREVLKPHLKEIIILITECISDFESEQWNKVEMEVAASRENSNELSHLLNDMRIKSSKESLLYDILGVCKDMLTDDVLDETIPELIKIIKKGVGISTRAAACDFIIQVSIERPELFKLKFAKRIFKSCVEILSVAKNTKESLLKVICRLGGSLFRILSKSFKTVQGCFDEINDKLCISQEFNEGIEKCWISYLLIIREAIKNLKEFELTQDKGALVEQIVPFLFVIKNNTLEDTTKREQIFKLGNEIFKDIFDNRISIPVEAYEGVILNQIKILLDSSDFILRSNGAVALLDLSTYLDQDTFLQKLNERKIIELLINKNFSSQFFKEYISCLRQIIEFGVGGIQCSYVRSNATLLESIAEKLTEKCASQLAKSDSSFDYK